MNKRYIATIYVQQQGLPEQVFDRKLFCYRWTARLWLWLELMNHSDLRRAGILQLTTNLTTI